MAATLRDVAELAGVSIKTVSNVVRGYKHVKESTRTAVLAAIEQTGYQPNISARSLRIGRSGVIGLALPELALPYFAELAGAVISEAKEHGVTVLIEQTGAELDAEYDVLRSPSLQLTDGLIFSPLAMSQDDVARLEVDYPLVILGERIFDPPCDHVVMDNVVAARAATEHLIAAGCRRIAAIGAHLGEDQGSAALRLRGYREALEAAGLPYDESLVGYVGLWHRLDGAQAMHEVLARGVAVDGVFGMNDTLAFGALRALQDEGRRVPDEVKIIGFDDLDETRYTAPSLSTVDPGRLQIAQQAVRVLLSRIEERRSGGAAAAPRRYTTPFRIVERESTRRADAPAA
ncbi:MULTISPECIES: LacI family DNA-binding transcriptional regulator [Microbacterium]|uniref:LacI family transcriptional regulator n=1 Tax=Microbacterium barkeri TaxID=33917 RepID=A0A9W6H598_9MICO|nr:MULTISPECIES: LacI family DNA-binding transcriptional regulator [Microbacterium]MDI6944873.1 LacI family DNA-binding transcriptional regulator [Microbacterium barkeri]MDR6877069.1 DNA-binding LacI/PurR family transcriptional regulator [Microbacterium barkeri]WRH16579.1 LacI family DNA-binding transcriptional regulator [Microbacterium sp. JZ37]GLJ62897.1 LacI family transcriptional regulator [Microbacterium barkeri]